MKLPRNIWLLVAAQALCASAAPLNTLAGGLVGTRLAPSPSLATLPVALLLVGLSVATVPTAYLSARVGRRAAFVAGASVASLAALSAAVAIAHASFWWFCASIMLLGANQALVQQYRFAAVEMVPQGQGARAISTVLLGTLVAAWLGPELAKRAHATDTFPRLGTAYLLLSGVTLLGAATLGLLCDLGRPQQRHAASTSVATLFRRPGFVVAMAGSGLGYAVMVFVMTATPLSMHVVDGHSTRHTASVIQSHIVAMFAPSLVSGRLVGRFGSVRVLWAGLVAVIACLAVGAWGHALAHYYVSLILLGIGWNFLYVGATALLVSQYSPEERGTAESVNDFVVFTLAATGSLLSGTAMEAFGWLGVLSLATAPTGLLLLVLLWYRQAGYS